MTSFMNGPKEFVFHLLLYCAFFRKTHLLRFSETHDCTRVFLVIWAFKRQQINIVAFRINFLEILAIMINFGDFDNFGIFIGDFRYETKVWSRFMRLDIACKIIFNPELSLWPQISAIVVIFSHIFVIGNKLNHVRVSFSYPHFFREMVSRWG